MNWSRASISSKLRISFHGGIGVSGLPFNMVSLISVSLGSVRRWGVKAGPSPETPWRFAPWQATQLVAYNSLAFIVDGVDVGAGVGADSDPPQESKSSPTTTGINRNSFFIRNPFLHSSRCPLPGEWSLYHKSPVQSHIRMTHATKNGARYTEGAYGISGELNAVNRFLQGKGMLFRS